MSVAEQVCVYCGHARDQLHLRCQFCKAVLCSEGCQLWHTVRHAGILVALTALMLAILGLAFLAFMGLAMVLD